jgi:hypothetical protein
MTDDSTRAPRSRTEPFRAKSAGASLIAILALSLTYLASVAGMDSGGGMPTGAAGLAAWAVMLFMAVEAVLQAALAIGAGSVVAADDRDRCASAAGHRAGHPVLVLGALAVAGAAFLGAAPFALANLAIVGLALAEATRFAATLASYRRAAGLEGTP